jgi:hypothetical protein
VGLTKKFASVAKSDFSIFWFYVSFHLKLSKPAWLVIDMVIYLTRSPISLPWYV